MNNFIRDAQSQLRLPSWWQANTCCDNILTMRLTMGTLYHWWTEISDTIAIVIFSEKQPTNTNLELFSAFTMWFRRKNWRKRRFKAAKSEKLFECNRLARKGLHVMVDWSYFIMWKSCTPFWLATGFFHMWK